MGGLLLFNQPVNSQSKYFLLLIILAITVSLPFACKQTGCSAFYWLNHDMTCSVRDEHNGGVLVEYFNLDTNELRLYVQQDGEETLIEHPYGKVASYSGSIDDNVIKFDPINPQNLLVNGENFQIVKKQ